MSEGSECSKRFSVALKVSIKSDLIAGAEKGKANPKKPAKANFESTYNQSNRAKGFENLEYLFPW
jgi:hypothetical protein